MKKGELSGPIKTPYGWHVVLVEDKRLAEPPAFEEMQDALKQVYAERHMQDVLQAEREKAKVKIYKPSL
jgi:peptidyl-prolyl cis-trans isomerase C